jgi:hypothetical protein
MIPLVGSWFYVDYVIREVGFGGRRRNPLLVRESRERRETRCFINKKDERENYTKSHPSMEVWRGI